MRKKETVSVIVPVYGTEKYLKECVDSILSQTLQELEIILVDDGSPDQCPTICDNYAKLDPRVQVIHKENGGLLSARKAGLAKAGGKYIGFVDSDDKIAPDYFQTLYAVAEEQKADIVCAGYQNFGAADTRCVDDVLPEGVFEQKGIQEYIFPYLLCADENGMRSIDSVCSKLFRRSVFLRHGLSIPDGLDYMEDFIFSKSAMLSSKKIVVKKGNYGYFYRYVAASTSHAPPQSIYEQLKAALELIQDVIQKEGIQYSFCEQFDNYKRWAAIKCLNYEIYYSKKDWKHVYRSFSELFSEYPSKKNRGSRKSGKLQYVFTLLCETQNPCICTFFVFFMRNLLNVSSALSSIRGTFDNDDKG